MVLMALEKRLQKQLLKRLNNSYKPKSSLDFSYLCYINEIDWDVFRFIITLKVFNEAQSRVIK